MYAKNPYSILSPREYPCLVLHDQDKYTASIPNAKLITNPITDPIVIVVFSLSLDVSNSSLRRPMKNSPSFIAAIASIYS